MRNIFIPFLLLFLSVSVSYAESPKIGGSLSFGKKGGDVAILQRFLIKVGALLSGLDTGFFGNLTKKAVMEFQKKNGLDPVGIVGPQTADLINKMLAIKNKTASNVQASSFEGNSNQNINKSIPSSYLPAETALFSEDQLTSASSALDSGNVRVIIRYKNIPSAQEQSNIRFYRGNAKRAYRLISAISAEVPASAITSLRQDPNILSIEKDIRVRVNIATDIEYANSWGVVKIGADIAHKGGNTGREVKIAVLDTGIDYNHIDIAYAGGYNFISNTADAMDDNGHGTHVAGILAALGNGTGVVGVAPDIKIYALKVLDASGSGYVSDVISAIEWSIENGMHITNNSYGSIGYPGTALEEIFRKAESAGVLSIAAVGNSGTCSGDADSVNYPAKFESVIAVAATDSDNNRACFSGTGSKVELSAPGINVYSTKSGGGYLSYSGTSMATPHVAGAAAVVYGAGIKDFNNNLRVNDDVRSILSQSALDLGNIGMDSWHGYGLVKADGAITLLSKMLGSSPASSTPALDKEKNNRPSSDTSSPSTPNLPTLPWQAIERMNPVVPSASTGASGGRGRGGSKGRGR